MSTGIVLLSVKIGWPCITKPDSMSANIPPLPRSKHVRYEANRPPEPMPGANVAGGSLRDFHYQAGQPRCAPPELVELHVSPPAAARGNPRTRRASVYPSFSASRSEAGFAAAHVQAGT